MASTIVAGNITNGGTAVSSDSTGILEIKTGTGSGTTALTLDASQNVTAANNLVATEFTSASTFGFKNRIMNGGMVIDQRNGGASVVVGTGAYAVDRFRAVETTDGTATAQQSTTAPTGFVNSLLYTVTASDSSLGATQYAAIEQRIEGYNVSDLNWGATAAAAGYTAASVTLSFWVRASINGIYCVGLYNSSGARSYTAEYTINVANTWEKKTITVPGDTSGTWLTTNGIGVVVSFTLAVGSTYQQAAGAWGTTSFAIGTTNQTNMMATNGATFSISGVQFEKGSTATSFDYLDYGRSLAQCQRYFYNLVAAAASAASTTTVEFYYQHPVPMRSAPSSQVIGAMRIEDPVVAVYTQSSGASTISQASPLGMKLGFANFTGLTSARPYYVASLATNVTASPPTSVCQISAEL